MFGFLMFIVGLFVVSVLSGIIVGVAFEALSLGIYFVPFLWRSRTRTPDPKP